LRVRVLAKAGIEDGEYRSQYNPIQKRIRRINHTVFASIQWYKNNEFYIEGYIHILSLLIDLTIKYRQVAFDLEMPTAKGSNCRARIKSPAYCVSRAGL
jgi:hypothetical protein